MSSAKQLITIRQQVTYIDKRIIKFLSDRFKLTSKIQQIKKKLHIPISQKQRENNLIEKYSKFAVKRGLPTSMITKLFSIVFSYSKKSGIIKRL